MPSPVRRAAGQARRVVRHARRPKSRVEAVEHLRRTLNDAERTVMSGVTIGDGAVAVAQFDPGP